MTSIEDQLLGAHADKNPALLAGLYGTAADQAEAAGDTDRACFFLTHAWIFALDAGCKTAFKFKARLVMHGRDTK